MATLNQTWFSQQQKCQCLSPTVTQTKAVLPGTPKCDSLTAAPGSQPLPVTPGTGTGWGFLMLCLERAHTSGNRILLQSSGSSVHNLLHFVVNQEHLIFLLKCFFYPHRATPAVSSSKFLIIVNKKKLSHFFWRDVRLLLRVHLSFCLITTVWDSSPNTDIFTRPRLWHIRAERSL